MDSTLDPLRCALRSVGSHGAACPTVGTPPIAKRCSLEAGALLSRRPTSPATARAISEICRLNLAVFRRFSPTSRMTRSGCLT